MFRRLIGLLMLLIGLFGVVLSVVGVIVGQQFVDSVGANIDQNLILTSEALTTVEETLVLAKETVADVDAGMQTVEGTAVNLSRTINETRPLIGQISTIASDEVPDSLEAVQESLPNVAEVAGAIDSTLTTLSAFRIDQTILGINLNYDLGINYDPEVPFQQTVGELGSSLDGLPERLRSLRIYTNVANENLGTISRDVLALSRDLKQISSRIAETDPLLDEYIRIVSETNDRTRQTRATVSQQLATAKLFLTVVMIWLGLTQIAPLYLGWELLTGHRLERVEVVEEHARED